MSHNTDKNQERNDFIRLGALLVITGAFFITTMTNADAAVKKYDLEKICSYDVPEEQVLDRVSQCLKAINFNIKTLQMELRLQIEEMDRVRHKQ